MITLLKEVFTSLFLINKKHKFTSRITEIFIIDDNIKFEKYLKGKIDDVSKAKDSLNDWSMIAVKDANGTTNTLPALVLSEEESDKLQQILAKYNL